ncbi:MAG TPA: HAMP domain-containing sensor histidine kinase, partial [Vicinamibacterales bacterium]|nr:HAMP domain-containing sensor histidine kinase [Vicinamibacterales bacterium]
FAAIDTLLDPAAEGPALTIYGASGRPLAWAGRPSELPRERVLDGANLFVAHAALGLRLVAVEPIAESERNARRLGTVAAEARLSVPDASRQGETYVVETAYGPVTFRRSFGERDPDAKGFVIAGPNGAPLLEATIAPDAGDAARSVWLMRVDRLALAALALVLVVAATIVVLERQARRQPRARGGATVLAITLVWLAWLAATVAVARGAAAGPSIWGTLGDAAMSPDDFAATGLACLVSVMLLVDPVRRAILARRGRRHAHADGFTGAVVSVALQALAGLVLIGLHVAVLALVQEAEQRSAASLLRFGVAPWEPLRLARLAGLVLVQAAACWAGVLVCRTTLSRWRGPGGAARWLIPLAWVLPSLLAPAIAGMIKGPAIATGPLVLFSVAVAATAWLTRRGIPWFRHGSQASRLGWLLVALLIPAWLLYPVLVGVVERVKTRLVEDDYAKQVRSHPEDLLETLKRAERQIDAVEDLPRLVAAAAADRGGPSTEAAFTVWRSTELEEARLTSAVELYGPDGVLVSRFALNFPEAEVVPLRHQASSCQWSLVGEVQPFGADERRMLHAERDLCVSDGRGGERVVGAVVAYVMLDYSALSFISSQSPYYEFFRVPRTTREGTSGSDVELTVFGWGRLPMYTSLSRSWLLTDEVFNTAYRSRAGFWTELARGDGVDRVYVSNDRNGIYVVGYPVMTPFTHLVNLGELTAFAALLFAVLIALTSLLRSLIGPGGSPLRLVVQEIRVSFYRKLFIAFVAATLVPVLALALLVRASVASQLLADAEAGAARTALTAKRVIEESLALQQRELAGATVGGLNDDVMVWISRIIDQDVNIFDDTSELQVTSERDLFASGLLPTRTPAQVHRAVAIDRLPTYVGQDRIGDFAYLVAAAPVRIAGRDRILTVPLALRQREIEREIADLDRAVLLGALMLILLGAGLGYWMAERIGDPVQRLTRATRRIAAGDLSTRVIVRTADELQRLVEAFNRMAGELQRQRSQVERTHRLEAWAEMARQVAHDIKNPLTPIQLSAEHLRRVHHDRGEPLAPVLDTCVDTILTQVRLLRQIASEFSSFGSSPIARPAATSVADLLHEVVDPYVVGVRDRVAIALDVEPGLPPVMVDRMLLSRAVINILENALHAMPGGGSLTVAARRDGPGLLLSIADTGVGMDAEASARIFEPYFSTKASGTGLGLSIARRNVELHGGTIAVTSTRGVGTTVTIALPLTAPPASTPPA